ncbi:hypothetical protein INR49_031765 [Caranx melampygus]|nr:hypothetical protein INR49_031765 [Caranx melampygus]
MRMKVKTSQRFWRRVPVSLEKQKAERRCCILGYGTEEGVEVVWNEVMISERRKTFKLLEEKVKAVFDNLIHLEHAISSSFTSTGLTKGERARVISSLIYVIRKFEAVSKEEKKNHKSMNEKLSPLMDPPIIHGNLTCDTIFIQHNGLIKIGSDGTPGDPGEWRVLVCFSGGQNNEIQLWRTHCRGS